MSDLIPILERFGLPVALLVVFLWFIWRGIWPFLVKLIQDSMKDRSTEIKEFLISNKRHQDQTDELIRTLKGIESAFKTMEQNLKNLADQMGSRPQPRVRKIKPR